MKITFIGSLMALLLVACSSESPQTKIYEPGISRELADFRKSIIQELTYNLHFCIPQEKDADILAQDTIGFVLEQPHEVLLDFREEPEKIHSVSINGVNTACDIRNEHIILPADKLQKGNNQIIIHFIAGNQSLNRSEDYLYTLFVPDRARTAFPCMDQPNLKAKFTLTLSIPEKWTAVSNTYCQDLQVNQGTKKIHFAQTEPLSTYLFAFAAGMFEYQTYSEGNHTIGAYYRETDPKRVAQLPEIFRQVVYSLNWQEEFTGMPYPFAKYDLVILPGFQFGGMEHTGATFYNDNTIFLSEHPTLDEELSRAQLIAHETSHMWFGDCVTMDWFNDVWTKEVFANYFAAAITTPLFPQINHELNWIKTYAASSLSEDRTLGGTAIRQELDNMRNAGLIYNNIIYNKAPVMMKKLVELMGEEAFQRGIRTYLKKFKYGNATWEDLVTILDQETDADLAAFSYVWVNQKGMPSISITLVNNKLTVSQQDPYDRGLLWPQSFRIALKTEHTDSAFTLDVTLDSQHTDCSWDIPEEYAKAQILPNADGKGYGLFLLAPEQLAGVLQEWPDLQDATMRFATLSLLHENYLANRLTDKEWMDFLLEVLPKENDALTASTLIGYLREPLQYLDATQKSEIEKSLWQLTRTHTLYSARVQLLRQLFSAATSQSVVDHLYNLWENQSNELLSINDYTTLSYELAIRMPRQSRLIVETQRKRIENPDRLRQFDFISRAVSADTAAMDSLFMQLISDPQARRIEPWTTSVLSLLNHPLRQEYSVKYIRPALEALEEVQRTGDIFFPGNWCRAVLGNYRSAQAFQEVQKFMNDNPSYLELRKNKILLGSFGLYRKNGVNLFGK